MREAEVDPIDIRMPIIMAGKPLKPFGAHPETKEVSILVTTALIRPEDRAACLEAGCNGYMVRRFKVVDLQNTTRELLTT